MVDDVHSLLGVRNREVVEHDAVDPTLVEHLLQLIEVAHLNFNLQVEMLVFQVLMTAVDSIGYASSEIDMVVLQQNHIEKTNTMVHATAKFHGLLFEHTHTRCGLARVENMTTGAGDTLHIFMCHRGDATHALHDIKH